MSDQSEDLLGIEGVDELGAPVDSDGAVERGNRSVDSLQAVTDVLLETGVGKKIHDALENAFLRGAAAERVKTEAAEAKLETTEDALHQIVSWSEAYPLSVFPKPDLKRAAEILKAGGMTLDSISADNMRHVVDGVGKIARAALDGEG